MKRIVVVTALLLASMPALAFRPLCNSLGGGGGQFDDGCGACSPDSMARWEPASVGFAFDHTTVPASSGVSAARWAQDINNALASWNAVPGSSLVMGDAGNATTRSWGGNSAVHEIFWSVNDAEWSDATGTAPNGGALGITAQQYACDQNGDGRREPWTDADIILNGTPGLGRTWNCEGLNCPSSSSVLIHELGHAVGLGHPCAACADALMGATLVVNADRPLPDDALSLLSLYGTDGALGMPCGVDGDCTSGSCGAFAMPSGTLRMCTQSCGTCPTGLSCNLGGQCELSSAPAAFLPGVGEPCGFTCEDDCLSLGGPGSIQAGCNACLIGNDGNAVCVKGCSRASGSGCDLATEFCSGVGTADDQGACKPRRDEGGACNSDDLCVQGLRCVANVCRPGCDPGNAGACSAGQTCTDDGSGTFTCRGALAGESCNSGGDCAGGLTCSGLDPFFCFVNCDVNACAGADEVCATTGGGAQICVIVRDVGESCSDFNVLCRDGAACVGAARLCSRPCDLGPGGGCDSGELCQDIGGEGLCLPDGGAAPGETCAISTDCQATSLCHAGTCTLRCDLDVPCPFGQDCVDVSAGAVCIAPAAGEGEGEGEGESEPAEGEGEGDPPGCGCGAASPADGGLMAIVMLLMGLFSPGGRAASDRAPSLRSSTPTAARSSRASSTAKGS